MPSKPKPRLLFLNRCYWPDSEATGQLLADLCESLASDFDVHVICGQPNSPSTNLFRAEGIETRNGVTIHRRPHAHFAKRVPAGRLVNLISFAAAAGIYLRRTNLRADLLISETDPFLLPIVAARHARRVGARFVCYLQDIYPDVAEAIDKVRSGWLTQQIRRRLRNAYLQADRVVVLGDCMRTRLVASPWSLKASKLVVIPNWADCQSIQPVDAHDNEFRRTHDLCDRFIVMHSGNMGLTQRLDVLVKATESVGWPAHAVLMLVGDGAARADLQTHVARERREYIRFLPYQPRHELAVSLSAADLHVVSMDERITGCLCPSKLYGILAAGKPVLAIAAKETDLCRIVAGDELGWCCEPGDADAIANAVAIAASNAAQLAAAGTRARSVACNRFDRPVVLEQFKAMVRNVLTEQTSSSLTGSFDKIAAAEAT